MITLKRYTLFRLLVAALLLCLVVSPLAAQEPATNEESAPTGDAEFQPSGATLLTGRSIFVEPMGEGFDKFLISELGHAKELSTVTSRKQEADLWMKGVITILEVGRTGSAAEQESDHAHSALPVTGIATVVVLPRCGKEVIWEGTARLLAVPGTRIPSMAKVLVAKLRKAVKEPSKAGQSRPIHP